MASHNPTIQSPSEGDVIMSTTCARYHCMLDVWSCELCHTSWAGGQDCKESTREVKGSRRETRISANPFLQAREPSQLESPQGRVLQQKDVFVLHGFDPFDSDAAPYTYRVCSNCKEFSCCGQDCLSCGKSMCKDCDGSVPQCHNLRSCTMGMLSNHLGNSQRSW